MTAIYNSEGVETAQVDYTAPPPEMEPMHVPRITYPKALTGADLSKFTLHNADFTGTHLVMADMPTRIFGVDFIRANLTRVKFSHRRIDADFSYADLTDADFSYATIAGSFYKANLTNTNLHRADWRGLKGCTVASVCLPDGVVLNAYMDSDGLIIYAPWAHSGVSVEDALRHPSVNRRDIEYLLERVSVSESKQACKSELVGSRDPAWLRITSLSDQELAALIGKQVLLAYSDDCIRVGVYIPRHSYWRAAGLTIKASRANPPIWFAFLPQ